MRLKILFRLMVVMACCVALPSAAHSGKARFHVVADTDAAGDDLRSLAAMLASDEIEVLAVTASDGSLPPQEGAAKVRSMLHALYHEGIPVAAGREVLKKAPDWRTSCRAVPWGPDVPEPTAKQAAELIVESVMGEEEPVTFIGMGTMTNLADALALQPEIKDRIERIVWYNGTVRPWQGFNYESDKKSARAVLASGIPIDVVSAGQEPMAVADLPLFTELSYRSKYVKYAQQIHTQAPLDALVRQRHSKVWDEWLPVYLIAPELFETETVSDGLRAVQVADVQQAGRVWLDLLNEQRNNDNRVFAYFPEDTALFLPDIRSYMAFMLDHYGKSEFRAGVIANELHGHLGIYAIVGVKMGLRAREYFNVGVDDIRVVSYAGSKPPVSCMNDGLQVGTGGTLGHGLIRLAEEAEARPQADFSFKNRSIRLTLKPEYAQRIAGDVRQAVADYGNLTEPYWDRIRELAVRYWAEFDRHELFILSEIP